MFQTENEYNRAKYRARKNSNICVRCGGQDAYTLAGRSACARCAELIRNVKAKQAINQEWKEIDYARNRVRKEKRKENGLCPKCGRTATPGYVTCEYCRIKHREYMRNKRNSFTRGMDGICWMCNKKPSKPGFHLCEDCYANVCKSAAIGRESQRRMKQNGWVHPWKQANSVAFK